ncbi:hypothetical protein Cgig2_010671 [Carnegiea gigantea]|uniref:Core-2/I-branching beta-1,6-N-acetylglucosaminyltransferase family protein n=1 Tax=Carnegiea gigantea TaxID=171969 RepID=A0A9Q1KL00_9CARY|nr:hypothetical protein Cgig2_010671 [Carnegiea gigantea]
MLKDRQCYGFLALTMKILNAHLNLIKLFSYFLIALGCSLAFGITLSFYSESFSSLNHTHFQTPQNLSTTSATVSPPSPPPPPPPIPEVLRLPTSSNNDVEVMSDEELMWRASMTPMNTQVGVPKVAFLFLVKGSIPFAPLWEKFFKGHQGFYSVYVHSDPSFNSSSSLSGMDDGVFRGRRIPSQEVEWGKFSMVEAELRLLANALLDDPSNQRFVLLSESCIPLFNFTTIYSYLINATQTYIESYDLVGPTGRGRYKSQLGPTVTVRQWRKGSQWFELDRDMAVQVISDQGYFLLFKRACKSSCYADEHYLPTWVNMNKLGARKNSNRSLTWVDWSKGGWHPARYRRTHITIEFLERLRGKETCEYNGKVTNICYLFARKFLPDTLYRLMIYAPRVMHF